ncbi:MAG: aldo/keto reductase, partial [Propylenella sp.]
MDGPRGSVRLKWHKLRTNPSEAPFKPANLVMGWRRGASLEIDILACGDGRFAVLHDPTLAPSTTGRGRVAETKPAAMRGLHHRDGSGNGDADAPVLSLAELLAPLASAKRAKTASLQLDLKVLRDGVPKRAIADAAKAAAGLGDGIIVGSHFLDEARRLAAAIPGARLGYDPMLAASRDRGLARNPERLLRHMEQRSEGVTLAFIRYDVIVAATASRFPLVDRLLDLGIETDAWTLNPGPGLTDKVLAALVQSGVRQITTDAPAELHRRIEALGREPPKARSVQRGRPGSGKHVPQGRPKPMHRRDLPGVTGKVSPIALGFEFFKDLESAAPMLDAFYAAGGNLFDTAYVYGAGLTETIFGEWLLRRGVRDDTVIIGKGAHTPHCHPEAIGRQLSESLERLKTDRVDIYFMHRDNPDVPVGEFVDAMDAEVKKGRIHGLFGGSNWERERIDAANAYAKKAGKQGFGAISNNFALAEMQGIIWPGCVSSSSDDWKTWLKKRQIPNFAWSSQGRGFFTENALNGPVKPDEVARVWHSKRNFVRRDHANQLAKALGRSPIHVALAYVLVQPFPVVPLIGPRTVRELDDSLQS